MGSLQASALDVHRALVESLSLSLIGSTRSASVNGRFTGHALPLTSVAIDALLCSLLCVCVCVIYMYIYLLACLPRMNAPVVTWS
jgi:hypothetical protein